MASVGRSIAVSVLFTLFGGPGIVLVVFPWLITRFRVPADEATWVMGAAWTLIVLGMIPLLESIVRFVRVGRGTLMPNMPTERLVVSGLYRYVRNPMYVGDLVVLVEEAVLFRSGWMYVYAVAIWAGFDMFIRKYEEPTLRKRHGSEYMEYCGRVGRWWPRLLG